MVALYLIASSIKVKSTLSFLAVSTMALVSFGKQCPPNPRCSVTILCPCPIRLSSAITCLTASKSMSFALHKS